MAFFDHKHQIGDAVITSALVAAIVGTVFGVYGPALIGMLDPRLAEPRNGPAISLEEESDQVVAVVEKVSPAVVSIVATQDLPVLQRSGSPFREFCSDPFFRQFFGECGSESVPRSSQPRQVGAGSGFIVRSDGLAVTNKHVVDLENAEYTAITTDGKRYSVKVIARDPFQDLAIIKLEGSGFPAVTLGDSESVKAGQTVLAIGNALGQFSNSVSKGIISGVGRSVLAGDETFSERLEKVLQTDAAINPGNSGGPLINLRGEVIGVNTAIAADAQNVGFALPINRVKNDIEDVEKTGRIIHPYLGVRYAIMTPEVKKEYQLSVDYGAIILPGPQASDVAVVPGSPAAKAGLKERDVILEIDGEKVTEEYSLAEAIRPHNVGDRISLKVLRENREIAVSVVLEEKK